ncbi:DUF2892 domain-containing protein [Sediminibacter sp. Hel_I_10]|uniref:YgaP family membrane protein n=1 Tax=Sediminibacter sp. Hel_I_10 TaxID=1392490 RepID=UPI000478BAD9|nr:DUF2892 domain-containing protein [Sediminibacter sp. Hel_I_10]
MKKNMGLPDRIIRVVIATIAPVLYVTNVITGVFAILLLAISGVLLLTSLVRICPLYLPFGINTDKTNEH